MYSSCESNTPEYHGAKRRRLVNLYTITDHPKFELFETGFPTSFVLLHPISMRGGIRNIDNDFHQVVPIDDFTLAPMALDFLCFVAGGAGCGYSRT